MERIDIPFMLESEKRMVDGLKIATSRSKRYGYPGDYFVKCGRMFVITQVTRTKIGTVAHFHHREEGFKTPRGFIQCWKKLHPRQPFSLGRYIYFHEFRLQSELLPSFHVHTPSIKSCDICKTLISAVIDEASS